MTENLALKGDGKSRPVFGAARASPHYPPRQVSPRDADGPSPSSLWSALCSNKFYCPFNLLVSTLSEDGKPTNSRSPCSPLRRNPHTNIVQNLMISPYSKAPHGIPNTQDNYCCAFSKRMQMSRRPTTPRTSPSLKHNGVGRLFPCMLRNSSRLSYSDSSFAEPFPVLLLAAVP